MPFILIKQISLFIAVTSYVDIAKRRHVRSTISWGDFS